MSTLAVDAAGAIASAVPQPPSLMARLTAAREAQAKHRVLGILSAMDDARLQSLGFSADDITALRNGKLQLPR